MLPAAAVLLCTAAALSATAAAQGGGPTVRLAPSDDKVRYFGRVDRSSPEQTRFAWVMTGVGATFVGALDGAALRGNFTTPKDGVRLRVMVDGALSGFVKLKAGLGDGGGGNGNGGMTEVELVSGLPAGSHTVEVLKVSEDNTQKKDKGVMAFGGFGLTGFAAFAPPPPPNTRKIEFIGDSDTAGWCADGSSQTNDNADKYQDAYQTWAQQIARNVSAETTVEAVSGYGVEVSTPAIQPVMDNTLGFASDGGRWNYTAWVPDAVVILIGPNDESFGGRSSSSAGTAADTGSSAGSRSSNKRFITAYMSLLTQIAANYEDVPVPPKIVHVCGGSLNGLQPCSDIQSANDQFNAGMHHHGRPMVGYYTSIEIEHWNMINGCKQGSKHCNGKSNYNGCDGHYNERGHAVLAADILPQFKRIMGW